MRLLLGLALLLLCPAAFARPRRVPLPRQDPRPSPRPDFQAAREALLAARMRASAFEEMRSLPQGDDALRPTQEDLDRLRDALHPVGFQPAGDDARSQPLLRFDAAMAQAQLVARHPATPQDLAQSLRLVADAGDALVELDDKARAARLSERADALSKALAPAAAP